MTDLLRPSGSLVASLGPSAAASAARNSYTPDQIMDAIAAALKARDMPGAVTLLHHLAVKDPDSAQAILDAVTLAGGAHG